MQIERCSAQFENRALCDFVAIVVVVNDDAVVGFNAEDFKDMSFSFYIAPHCL